MAPSPFWLGLTSFYTYSPQNQAYVEEQGDQYAQNADSLIYNGPYILEEFDPTQGVTMVKNDDYWDSDTVDIQRVEGRIVKELDTAVNLYESGELDETEIHGQFVDEFRGTPDFWSQTYFAAFYMVLQRGSGPALPERQRAQGHPDRLRPRCAGGADPQRRLRIGNRIRSRRDRRPRGRDVP